MFKKIIITLILILLIVPITVFAAEENLIKNPSFEETTSGYPNEWYDEMWHKATDYTDITVEDVDGAKVLQIANNFENDARLCQNIKVRGNRTYKLSGYIKADNVIDGKGANLSFKDVMASTDGCFDTKGQWQYVEMYGKTSLFQGNVTIYVRVGGYGSLSSGTAQFDRITLEEVKKVPQGIKVHSLKKVVAKSNSSSNKKDSIKFLAPSILITAFMLLGFFLLRKKLYNKDDLDSDGFIDYKTLFAILIFLGTLIRLILSIAVRGYPNDISCWIGWANATASSNLFGVYNLDIFMDYPPGYMYVLYPLGLLMRLIGDVPDKLSWLIVKIPPITADIILAFVIYKLAKKRVSNNKSLILSAIYFLNPAVILNSSAWGQIDGILALFVVLYVVALYDRKFYMAGIYLAIGVLMKIQMVLFAPLYLTAIWSFIREIKKDGQAIDRQKILKMLSGVGTGILTLFILTVPFFYNDYSKFFDIYLGSLGTYKTVSLNACNLWALLDGMWVPMTDSMFGIIPYATLTNIGLVLSIVLFLVIGFLDTKKEHIFMHAALLITGIFMLSGKMHERYMFTAIALLVMSYLYTNRKSSYVLFILFSVTQFINTALVLANEYIFGKNIYSTLLSIVKGSHMLDKHVGLPTLIISIVAVIGYAYMIYICFRMYRNKDNFMDLSGNSKISDTKDRHTNARITIKGEEGFLKKLTKMDALLMTALTVVYAIVAFVNLGSTVGPETNFETKSREQVIVVDFGEEKSISEMWYFRGKAISGAKFHVSYGNELHGEYQTLNYIAITHGGMYDDEEDKLAAREDIKEKFNIPGELNDHVIFSNYPDILKWFKNESQIKARYVKITFQNPMIYMFEMAFKDESGNVIPINEILTLKTDDDTPYQLLFDEQDTVPESVTYMNSTYFDEIYHAGTAWEHINYVDPYETTHPPLGKVIMSWGIMIFGTNTFGWRFMGTLFGVLMVPAMYLLAKLLLKKTKYAFIAAFLFTFDFMHFTQTRIATIDTYGVFFIILMYLFMGIYYYMNYNKSPLYKTLIPLGLSGISFGLGAASKWICIYAGAGLAVIFFVTMYKRWREYVYCKKNGQGINDNLRESIKDKYLRNTIITLLFCILFFIVIPIVIYVMSYIPIMKIGPSKDLAYVWRNQVNMFNYHSGLDSSHPFASPWYEWPLLIKPMWYYSNNALRDIGWMSSIAAFGNPAVWWVGTVAMVYLFVDTYLQKKPSRVAIFIIIAFLSQYLPWVLVPRSMFIYHYFASIPFVVIAIVMAIKKLEERKTINKYHIVGYLAVVVLLFAFFYPVLSGTPIPSSYGKLMQWMRTWWFTY